MVTGRKELSYRTSKLLKGKEGKREKIINAYKISQGMYNKLQ